MAGRDSSGYRERNSTADKALDILGMFSEDLPVVSGLEVASRLGVAKSTAYRYLQSLVGSHFLEEAPGGGFRLGLRILELARLARKSYGLSEVAAPVMASLAASAHETVLLTRRVGDLVVCLDRAESETHRVRISYERGSTLPINAGASALVLLAWTAPEEAREILAVSSLQRFTPNTLTSVDDLMARLAEIRENGYSVTRAEVDAEVLGVAAPIRDEAGSVVAAVSVAAVASRVSPEQQPQLVELVRKAGEEISQRLALTSD
ncbi:IclR family transcriptional regulator [Kibdelosporangium philippinense]|uniref:IclR family transcriptional regulator n=1 Tax=Kibdelosporangium philippinense TaxID=211113 RepID=A0ABS8ZUZ8_9PSEU|nr:IclR family transcriptional regulator [Kibdelosporangium philippinense]MCE7011068.1 IclR family transcriptional regulator [Kibdelosporangium philippinense]